MIIVISKDRDFSHTLAEQVVRELDMPCECLQHIDETKEIDLSAALAIVANEPVTHPDIPVLNVSPPLKIRQLLGNIAQITERSAPEMIELTAKMSFHPRSKSLNAGKKSVGLTDKETHLLQALVSAGDEGISKEQLLKEVWGFEADLNTHTLETHIYRLRAKCKELCGNEMIEVTNGGYRLIDKE